MNNQQDKKRYMGKGERQAYDARLGVAVEYLNNELGYYPSLRQLVEYLNATYIKDGSTITTVYTSLRRMIKCGILSADATKIYGDKNNGKAKGNVKKRISTKKTTKSA